MRNPPPIRKWDFPTSPTFASSPGAFEPGFRRFIPKIAKTLAREPNLVGNPPSRKWQIGIWASPGPHLGTGPLAFNLPRKNGVPRPWATHHRLRLTETVLLLQKLWGVLWICQSGAPKPFPGCIKPRAPLEQLPPAVFRFQKIGPGPKTSIFLWGNEVSIRRQPAGNPAATRRQPAGTAPGKTTRPWQETYTTIHNKNPSLVALGKKLEPV